MGYGFAGPPRGFRRSHESISFKDVKRGAAAGRAGDNEPVTAAPDRYCMVLIVNIMVRVSDRKMRVDELPVSPVIDSRW